jgi:cell division protein FtsB
MATDTKARTPGTKKTPQAPKDPNAPKAPARPEAPARLKARRAPRGSGGNGFPPDGGAPGGRPPGKTGKTLPPGKITSPRHTRPVQAGTPQPLTRQQRRQQRMPFILLLVGLLGGALISLLVISTTLDEGSYDINNLTAQNNQLYKDEEALNEQVASLQNPAVIATEAAHLGLRRQPDERFINPSTGAIIVAPAVTSAP